MRDHTTIFYTVQQEGAKMSLGKNMHVLTRAEIVDKVISHQIMPYRRMQIPMQPRLPILSASLVAQVALVVVRVLLDAAAP